MNEVEKKDWLVRLLKPSKLEGEDMIFETKESKLRVKLFVFLFISIAFTVGTGIFELLRYLLK